MGRVNRLLERRTLRRAADQALLTALTQRPAGAVAGQPGGAPDKDFEYRRSDPSGTGESFDHEPVTAPIPVAEVQEVGPDLSDDLPHDAYGWVDDDDPQEAADVYDLVPGQPDGPEFDDVRWVPGTKDVLAAPADDYGWDEPDEVLPPVRPLRARHFADAAVARPALGLAMPESRRWYRAPLASAVLVAAVITAVVGGGWLVFRTPSSTAERSTVDAPTNAPAAPSKQLPTAMSAPPRPPAPPPPPPPPPEEPAPQRQYSEPRYSPQQPAEKPRVDVTRAPMSVAPVPRAVERNDSRTPGDAPGEKPRRRGGCFGFC